MSDNTAHTTAHSVTAVIGFFVITLAGIAATGSVLWWAARLAYGLLLVVLDAGGPSTGNFMGGALTFTH